MSKYEKLLRGGGGGVTALTRAVPGERNKKHEKFFQEIRDIFGTLRKYRKIPKIRLGAYIFQRPFLRGLYSEGLIFGGTFTFQTRLG